MMRRSAVFSPCETYRYRLERVWNPGRGTLLMVMLNPSLADDNRDDRTVSRCIKYADRWGYGRLLVGNLFAFRSPYPAVLKQSEAPEGPDNDAALTAMAAEADLMVAAWGVDGEWRNRAQAVTTLIPEGWHALALTQSGHPRHPLRLRADLVPFPYQPPGES